jgi:tripartite-type tricarboxylate transporter receptor subunit TctC
MGAAILFALVSVSAFPQPAWSASADAWPVKPVRMVVPFPPGGAADATARLVADKLRPELGQPVIIDNRAGAAGNIGGEHAARAAPDGYTILMANSSLVTNVSLYKSLPYDFVRDFIPVSLVAFVPNVVSVNPNYLKINTFPEFIKFVKESKGKKVHYGSGGSGTSQHLSTSLFSSMVGVEMEHVSYKGGAPAVTALLGGEVQVVFAPLAEISALLDSGKLRPLAVTTRKRSPRLPDVPAIAEFLPGFDVALWTGVLVPSGTPEPIVTRLNAALVKVLNQPDLRQRLGEQGAEAMPMSPAEFRQFIASEVEKWGKLVKISGAQVQ